MSYKLQYHTIVVSSEICQKISVFTQVEHKKLCSRSIELKLLNDINYDANIFEKNIFFLLEMNVRN